jgi:hypothetical protein
MLSSPEGKQGQGPPIRRIGLMEEAHVQATVEEGGYKGDNEGGKEGIAEVSHSNSLIGAGTSGGGRGR